MNQHRIFILGNSILSIGLASLLDRCPEVEVVGIAATAEEALPMMANGVFDALMVTDIDDQTTIPYGSILSKYPDLPIFRADISQNFIQLITSQDIQADPDELLAALAALPRRS